MAATVGAGATAQLGAMRINEEIDALEVIGIRSVSYLASTRVVAGVVVAIPLFCTGLLTAYLAARLGTTLVYGQGSGVYDHYFNTFLRPTDVLWSLFEVVVVALMIMLVCTYYGFNAHGGPAGVGEAVGRAVRASMVVASIAIVIMTLAIYGQSGRLPPGELAAMKRGPGKHRLARQVVDADPVRGDRRVVLVTATSFDGTFRSYVPVTLTADRSGLVMDTDAKVMMRGVQVGRVSQISQIVRPRTGPA